MNVNDMTAQEAADWCAEQDGWVDYTACPDGWDAKPWKNHRTKESRATHPHPLTLDGADAAFPSDWRWFRAHGWWTAHKTTNIAGYPNYFRVKDTGDKIGDLYRLAALCRMAAKESNQ
jgi:hypothetical protein